jgi:leader peptidase (prepilin peptidase) / N-methyltransferase
LDFIFECALFLLGLVFGSFLNVCISRIPRALSVVRPGSHCPSCSAPIRWYDNVPIASWLFLRGRCRDCNAPIPWRYPAVELLTGILFAACFASFGFGWQTLKFCAFSFLLLGLIFMDVETGLLPREFTYTGIVLGLGLSWLAPTDSSGTQFFLRAYQANVPSAHQLSLLDSAIGGLAGAAFFFVAWALYYVVRKRHGLGFGDIALMAMSGAFLGLKLAGFVLVFALVAALVYVCLSLVVFLANPAPQSPASTKRRPFLEREIPFGAFLGVSSLAAIFIGESVWNWYLGLVR